MKQRLIGATVLVVLAVIFLPMFLSGTPKQEQQKVDLTIPSAPDRSFETRVVPLTPEPATPSTAAPAATEAPLAHVEAPAQVPADALDAAHAPAATPHPSAPTPADTAAKPPAAANPATPPPAPAVAAPTGGGRYAVSFGTYAKRENVDGLIAALKKAGVVAQAENVEVNGEPRFRVRSGPYVDRTDAEAARLKGKAARADAPGTVIQIDDTPPPAAAASAPQKAAAAHDAPAAAAPVAAASPAPATHPSRVTGWAVQVGAFATENEANQRRNQLRNAGFAAFIDPVKGEKGTLYRVRVGPEALRANAEKLRDTIKAKLPGDAIVVSHP